MNRFIIAALLLLGLGAGQVHAEAEPVAPMRVVVRIVGQGDAKLVSRIEGQVADLDVSLVRVRGTALAATVQQRFQRARTLARKHKARVVVWFDRAGVNAVRVFVAEPGRDTLFARRVATADESARAEAIAIVVRSTLSALAQGGQIGVRVARPVVPAAPVVRPASPRWRWNLGVHGQLSFDGESSPGQQGFAGRLDLARAGLQVGIVGTVGIEDQLRDVMTTVHLARHSVGLSAGLRLLGGEQSALWLGVDAGMVAYARSTTVVGGALTPAPAKTTVGAFAAPMVRGQWRALAGQPLWMTLELAAAFVVGAPELRYELSGAPVVRNELWPVQPSIGVGLRLEGL